VARRDPRNAVLALTEGVAARLGYTLVPTDPDFHWVPKLYGAKHRKLLDIRELEGFRDALGEVRRADRTYLGPERLHTLWQAAKQVPEGEIAEVGVLQGGSAHLLALAAPDRPIHAFDTFSHFPEVDPDIDRKDRSKPMPVSADDVRRYLAPFDNVEVHEGEFPATAAGLEDRRFGVVHLDTDTYSSFRAGFEFFAPRLVPGGIFVLDDYGFRTCPGAKQATDEFVAEHAGEYRFFHVLSGQGLLVKLAAG